MHELDEIIARRPAHRSGLAAWYRDVIAAAYAAGIRVADLAKRLGRTREAIYAWKRRYAAEAGEVNPAAVREPGPP